MDTVKIFATIECTKCGTAIKAYISLADAEMTKRDLVCQNTGCGNVVEVLVGYKDVVDSYGRWNDERT